MTAPIATPRKHKRVVKTPEARRADILRASREVFGTVGFADATIADITTAAGMGKGSFYMHFETKDHVLAALWEQYVNAFYDTTQEILRKGQAWWPTMDELLRRLLEHAIENAELHRLVYGSANGKALELCKESNARVIDSICDFVRRGAAAGAFQSANPEWAFRMVYHAADGLLDDLIADGAPIDAKAVSRSVLEMAHRTFGDPDLVSTGR
ncbi:TetR/AcrR family transcriptional regulator [Streptomyces sp. ME01-18a]|uniref:TetR/AcrR family transcriptional regulator n=1 Tax=Streptomyces sp. ME01-18a TaxID=3028669 RepID=UPI0029B77AF7|nr:TetR/AcrR family transcriptional regulator [Streptomyces sp. ME01-18a]MDX3434156.1 TetR/AcrR family transcriptional regulator [Streptomyces sp. ME01-18a]